MTTSPVLSITDELLAELDNTLTDHLELNTSNYGHDDVCQLNSWAIGACEALERANLHIRSLTERLEGAEKDAARYRFIRDIPHTFLVQECLRFQRNSVMDDIIDAAIALEGQSHE